MKHTVLPGFRLTMGFTLVYLALIVLLPLLTLPARSATMTWEAFWQTISDPRVVASYRLSIVQVPCEPCEYPTMYTRFLSALSVLIARSIIVITSPVMSCELQVLVACGA